MRIRLNEINLNRIYKAILRRFKSIPHRFLWSLNKNMRKERMGSFKNKYEGERCILVANGPSLKKMNLSFLKDEISFGLNRIYLAYDDMGFKNDYLVSINSLVLSQFCKEIENLNMPKFLNWESRKFFNKKNTNTNFIYRRFFGKKFGKNPIDSLNPAATVTYAALQIIYFMGFKEVLIIGMDHNFSTKQSNTPNKLEIRDEEEDVNHFHPNYFPKGSKWETPDLTSSEYFYRIARKEFEKDNRRIFDCTVEGKCQVFEKGDIKDFLS
ncbi:6-hydroxymethylpterin diphosphokinase MptE-like protein [Polaribacter septentrionalilitoris]|uniref:6-hydroxymethylpterin diphosphokinase MptE-like protein n=1 Tax=Polaribacter septentrionalilitoris TaxID=2494657 RepID=UPI001359C10D|nr:6-hydroxymethylpterin diphosphokinase MptE-like protein [Polaribacter septentrionalilitoris]